MAFKMPSKRTLDKYGLKLSDFQILAFNQGFMCKICQSPFSQVRCFIDHKHVKGFKRMLAITKRQYVRGLLCFTCNRYRVAKNTFETATRVAEYLSQDLYRIVAT